MFTDRVTLQLKAGSGGNGVIAWRREKYIPKGGPSGGNGGDGASIFIEADAQLFSLDSYRNIRLVQADDGAQGGGGLRHGKRGADRIVKVPLGTLVKDKEGAILHDFTQDKERLQICRGGKGGKGNNHFKTPTHRAPYEQTDGKKGEIQQVEFELKLIADVGLVGFPNSGKSTFISRAAKLRVKIAPYPFTTLQPNLGFVFTDKGEKILLADIPGIIEGAHLNKGLGLEFLRHIERTHLLLFIIDVGGSEGRDPFEDYQILLRELQSYDPELLKKPRAVVLNKIDLPDACEHTKEFRKRYKEEKSTLFETSAEQGQGLKCVVDFLKRRLSK